MNAQTSSQTIITVKTGKIATKRNQAISYTRQWEAYLMNEARAARREGDIQSAYMFYEHANNAREYIQWLHTASSNDISEFWATIWNWYTQNAN